jgi:hypothetical protein
MLGAIAAGVLPGYFWAGFLRPAGGLGERLAWSAALSLASVPVLALALARALGTGVTLGVAIVSIVVVLGSGALALVLRGPPAGREAPALRGVAALRGAVALRGAPGLPAVPVLPRPRAISDWRTLALIVAAFGVALAVALGLPSPSWLLVVMLAALVVAGALASAGTESGWQPGTVLREPVLAVVLALTAVRAYAGPVRHDWPYLRGSDMFSHAVMAEQMLAHGTYTTYLIYPPGFSTLTAVICRVSGLTPLALFPVLAPALLVLTTLAAYALATKVWGWEYGLAAAALSGLVLRGPYASFAEGRYPDLTAAYFLLVMLVAALITLYGSPTVRSGVLVAVVGGSVVLYHSVATLYLALLLAAVGVVGLPYLLLRQRQRRRTAGAHGQARAEVREAQHASVREGPPGGVRETQRADAREAGHAEAPDASRQGVPDAGRTEARGAGRTEARGAGRTEAAGGEPAAASEELRADGRAEARRLAWSLLGGLGGLGVLAVAYAGYTYLLGSSGAGTSGTSTAVSIAVGSQSVLSVTNVFSALSSAVVWLGVFGLAALVAGIRYLRRPGQVLTVLTLVLWFGLMYAGSRTAADGFPQRFERDLGGPLSVLGALGAGLILQSLARWRAPRRTVAVLAAAAAAAVVAIAGVQAIRAAVAESHPVHTGILDPQVAAAGAWLGQHNTGGTIISTPAMNSGITNRAVLAMGGYTGLQSYSPFRIAHPRSLPTAGRAPLLDSREVLTQPASCRSASIFTSQDVRYVILYRFGHAADLAGFRTDPARYRRVFENPSVVIYAPSHAPDDKCHGVR